MRTVRLVRRGGVLGAAAVLAAVAVPAFGQLDAVAAASILYVNNEAEAHCSDAGHGSEAQPYCTISAAAAVVLPGQTVKIRNTNEYNEQVTVSRSGTAAAPITFVGLDSRIRSPKPSSAALTISGAQHIRIKSLDVENGDTAVLVKDSKDVSILDGIFSAGVRVTGASEDVTIGQSDFFLPTPRRDAVVVDGGARHTVLTTNEVWADGKTPAISLTDAPDSVVVSNTVVDDCYGGVFLAGASSGATIENNVVSGIPDLGGSCDPKTAKPLVSVDQTSAVGTKTDYNVVRTAGRTAYDWSGTAYTDRAAFTAAIGQGSHDVFAAPAISDGTDPEHIDPHAHPLPTVDSADENAPGMLRTDMDGNAAVDDPLTPDTGTGSGIRDRGASERTDVGALYTPFGPSRILDSRIGLGVKAGRLDQPLYLQVAGRGGLPATGISAVTMNVTVTGGSEPGFLSISEGGTTSGSSNLNWTTGETIANQVTVPVSADGKVDFQPHPGLGRVHVIADVEGYYSTKGGTLHTTTPARALDTRDGTGAPAGAVKGGSTVDLQVTGAHGVPAAGVTAVTLNVTATAPTTSGFVTVHPHGTAVPSASSLNWTAGRTVANLVTVPVVDGKVSLSVAGGSGAVQLLADVMGYYTVPGGHDTYHPVYPERLMDTRAAGLGGCSSPGRPAGAIPAGGTVEIDVCSKAITAMMLNVTVTAPGASGVLTVYPSGSPRPATSNLNWTAGETIPNAVVVAPGANGKVTFYNHSTKPIHLVVDNYGHQAY